MVVQDQMRSCSFKHKKIPNNPRTCYPLEFHTCMYTHTHNTHSLWIDFYFWKVAREAWWSVLADHDPQDHQALKESQMGQSNSSFSFRTEGSSPSLNSPQKWVSISPAGSGHLPWNVSALTLLTWFFLSLLWPYCLIKIIGPCPFPHSP